MLQTLMSNVIKRFISREGGFVIPVFFFVGCFYALFGFEFGIKNNVEELPLLYKILGIADYPQDIFVQYHTSNFSQITPFLILVAGFMKLVGTPDFFYPFFILHAFVISIYYVVIHFILNKIGRLGKYESAIVLLLLFYFSQKISIVPANRWLFTSAFDLELVVFVILFGFFYFHIIENYNASSILLILASILYPTYTIPLYPAVLISMYFKMDLKKFIKISASYLLIPAGYSIYLWFVSRQLNNIIDASLIMEYVRAPWHYRILSINYTSLNYVYFYLFVISALIVVRNVGKGKKNIILDDLLNINIWMIVTLLFTSAIHSVVRIPLLVQISPYRIGVFVVMFSFLLAITSISFKFCSLQNFISERISKPILIAVVTIGMAMGLYTVQDSASKHIKFKEKKGIEHWIINNTDKRSLFLNYTLLEVRTSCFRSTYFNFKTIPLTSEEQVKWYRRFLLVNNLEDDFPIRDIPDLCNIEEYKINERHIYLNNKTENMDLAALGIDYIIVNAGDKLKQNYQLVYLDDLYKVFKIKSG